MKLRWINPHNAAEIESEVCARAGLKAGDWRWKGCDAAASCLVITFGKPNEAGACFSEDPKLLEPLPSLHAKETLGLAPAIKVAIAGKEISFGFNREVLRKVITDSGTEARLGFSAFRESGHRRTGQRPETGQNRNRPGPRNKTQ